MGKISFGTLTIYDDTAGGAELLSMQLVPSMDTSTYQDGPTTNYGASTVLQTGGYSGYYMQSYFHFDVSGIPSGSTIKSAKLYLYKVSTNTNGHMHVFTLRRITAPWDSMTLTHANKPAQSARYGPYYAFGPTNEWNILDATQLVQEWIDGTYPNYGMCTSPEVETSSTYTYRHNAAWASKEHATTGFRPYLLITYE